MHETHVSFTYEEALWGKKDEVQYLLETCDSWDELNGFINEYDYDGHTAWDYADADVKRIMQEFLDKKK